MNCRLIKKMAGLMFEKPRKYKRRRHHKKSILHQKDGTCYLCMRLQQDYRIRRTEEHHIYDGNPNRRISEENGFKVYLCIRHHREGPEAVHNNIEHMRILQQDAQREYEKMHTREEFLHLIGRNFLDEQKEEREQAQKGFFRIGEENE